MAKALIMLGKQSQFDAVDVDFISALKCFAL